MPTQSDLARLFLDGHQPGQPLLMPNAWDVGSAVLLAAMGFGAVATTSGGFAVSRGRRDGQMSRDEVLAHCAELCHAVDLPVSADLENCFAEEPPGVAATVAAAVETGLAGGSVEDYTGDPDAPIFDLGLATERVAAAAEAAHRGDVPFVLTARAENFIRGNPDLGDTIARLQAYQDAGADVLFAPRVVEPSQLAALIREVDRPVSVLVTPGSPGLETLAQLGVSRISVGGALTMVAYGAAVRALETLRQGDVAAYLDAVASNSAHVRGVLSR